jgi:hypothetical protein
VKPADLAALSLIFTVNSTNRCSTDSERVGGR